MAPIMYSGALMPKKKQELQDIAGTLKISDAGTKEELHGRIKKHLDNNPELEEDQRFAGLFTSRGRRRSVQPQPQPTTQSIIPSSRLAPASPETIKPKIGRLSGGLESLAEDPITPDVREVSMFLQHPLTPVDETGDQEGRQISNVASSHLAPPPASPEKSLVQQATESISVRIGELSHRVSQEATIENSLQVVQDLRQFLSNSFNLWTVTSVSEFLYIIYYIIPWKSTKIYLNSSMESPSFTIHYPPQSIFETPAFWLTLLHWVLPTLIIPTVFGHLISFAPRGTQRPTGPSASPRLGFEPASSSAPLDPLTVGIVRLAAQVGYPYQALENSVRGIDIIGQRWRVLNAAVLLAFAFAEAISTQPQTFARTMAQTRYDHLIESSSRSATPSIKRRAIMPVDVSASDEQEVD